MNPTIILIVAAALVAAFSIYKYVKRKTKKSLVLGIVLIVLMTMLVAMTVRIRLAGIGI